MKFIKFRGSCQSDSVVFCIHCDRSGSQAVRQSPLIILQLCHFRCGKKFVGDTARTLDKRMQVQMSSFSFLKIN